MQVTSDFAALARLAALEISLASQAREWHVYRSTVDDVLYGVITGEAAKRELLALLAGAIDGQLQLLERDWPGRLRSVGDYLQRPRPFGFFPSDEGLDDTHR
jgi:hypothetical protein